MINRSDDNAIEELDPSGFSSLQTALGFCALGLLGALFLTPVLSDGADQLIVAKGTDGVDRIVTGSVTTANESATRTYTVRQSVLNRDPSVPCIIFADGTQKGGC